MTSEVLVMNRLAVALAADSAVTVSDGRRDKVYNSANKLFMLSQRHPIGVMIYNNASLLGVPWESLVKLFRRHLADKELDYVADYADQLTVFLASNLWMFPADSQRKHVLDIVAELFDYLEHEIEDRAAQELGIFERETISHAQREKIRTAIAETVIKQMRDEWAAKDDSSAVTRSIAEDVYAADSGLVNDRVMTSFRKYEIGAQATADLRELVLFLISKADVSPFLRSGIVISGFGRKEVFPSFVHLHFGGFYKDILKYARVSIKSVTNDPAGSGAIETFADSGMANVFLQGIAPHLEVELAHATYRTIARITNGFVDSLPRVSQRRRDKLKSDLEPLQIQAARDWYKLLQEAQKETHATLVREGITSAQVDQLAHVAAALVNLNSFRKKMSLSPETVGGPVDVAVITKGDGFIWIDRKHYFKPELNAHYFRNALDLRPAEPSGSLGGNANEKK